MTKRQEAGHASRSFETDINLIRRLNEIRKPCPPFHVIEKNRVRFVESGLIFKFLKRKKRVKYRILANPRLGRRQGYKITMKAYQYVWMHTRGVSRIPTNWSIHHIDGDNLNDFDPGNLIALPHDYHRMLHEDFEVKGRLDEYILHNLKRLMEA